MPYALPPAESKLSLRTIAAGYLPARNSFAGGLSAYLGVECCVLADSARTLLYLLFSHLKDLAGKGRTDVLMPGYTCYSVPAAAVKAGLRVTLYDMDPATFQPDFDDVKKKISEKTLAVVGQHLLGVRSAIGQLTRISQASGAYCIEDSAQLLDASAIGKQEIQADFTIFSFGRGKPLPLGGGGAMTASGPSGLSAVSERIKNCPRNGSAKFMPIAVRFFSQPRFYWIMEKLPLGLGRTIYDPSFPVADIPRLYHNAGAAGLREIESLNDHRRLIGGIYERHLSGQTGRLPVKNQSPCVRYPILVKSNDQVGPLSMYGVRKLYPLSLCDLPALQEKLAGPPEPTRGAREIAGRLITLPTHRYVNEPTAGDIVRQIEKRFGGDVEIVNGGAVC